MKISINALFLTNQSTGMKTYLLGLLSGFGQLQTDKEFYVYLKNKEEIKDIPHIEGCHFIRIPYTDNPIIRFFTEILFIPYYDRKYDIAVSFSPTPFLPFNQAIPSVCTILDFCIRKIPKGYSFIQKLNYYLRIYNSLKNSTRIVTISNDVKKLIKFYHKNLLIPIDVLYLGVDKIDHNQFNPEKVDTIKKTYGISQKLILTSGGTNIRKNIDTLVKAFSKLPSSIKQQYQIVILGPVEFSRKNYILHLVDNITREKIIFTGFVGLEERNILYHESDIFVFPTLDEGFGLPVIEAMNFSLPIICSDINILREVCQDAAVYFPANDENALANLIELIFTDEKKKSVLIREGEKRVKEFSWFKSAKVLDTAINKAFADFYLKDKLS